MDKFAKSYLEGLLIIAMIFFVGCVSMVGKGDTAAKKGDWDHAVSYYKEAYEKKKGDPEIKAKLENAIVKAGEMHYKNGERAIAKHDYAKGINEFSKAISYEDKELYQEALRNAKIGKKKYDSNIAYNNGLQKLNAKSIPDAISYFEKALNIYSDNVQAKEALEKAINLKKEAEEYYKKGIEERDKKNWDEAISYFDKSLNIWSTNPQAKTERQHCVNHREYLKFFSEGTKYIENSEWKNALESLSKAQSHLSTDEVKEKVSFVKGKLYHVYFSEGEKKLQGKEWDEAIKVFEKARSCIETKEVGEKLKIAYYKKWFDEGEKCETSEKFNEAYECYEKALGYKHTSELNKKLSGVRKLIRENLTKYLEHTVEFPFLEKDNFLTVCSHLCGQKIGGSETNLIKLTLSNKSKVGFSGVKVKVELQGFSEPAVDTVTIPADKSVSVNLTPTFKKNIKEIVEQRPGNIYYSISDSKGNVLLEKTKKITLVSRNDIIWARNNMLGVFITPNDKRVDELITYAAEKLPGRTMAGYQKDGKGVIEEVKAIYDTIAELGIHYRSATKSFFDVKSLVPQRVYFPAECIESTGANCIDGAILFASAFENIGLEAAIVLRPSHAYVAVKIQETKDSPWLFIETTCVGASDFHKAYETGTKDYNKYSQKNQVTFLKVSKLREAGIKPFPLALGSKDFSLKDKLGIGVEKIYDITLDSAQVAVADFANNDDMGSGPEIYVRILQNDTEKINSRSLIARDSYGVSWKGHNISTRITMKKGDVIKIYVYDKDTVDDDLLFRWGLKWEDFVSKIYNNLRTRNGSWLKLIVKEIR